MSTVELPCEVMGPDGMMTKALTLREATCGDFVEALSGKVPLLLDGDRPNVAFGFEFARRLAGVAPAVAAKYPPAAFMPLADAGLEAAGPFLGT